jgi:3-oxoacyl-[acyl-carrier-protein] synthase-1
MHFRITDLNGEHYKFKEMTLAMVRYQRKPKPKLFDLWHPIEHIGDVGAAIGPLVLGVALHAGQKGYGNGPTVLCTFGNDDGERAAAVVTYHRRDHQP